MLTMMAACIDLIRTEFPLIDEELIYYVQEILNNGAAEFENVEDVYEAVGELLHEVGQEKSEDDVKDLCSRLLGLLHPEALQNGYRRSSGARVLGKTVHLASQIDENEQLAKDSVWVTAVNNTTKVDQKRLEKAEAKLAAKLERRSEQQQKGTVFPTNDNFSATASQATSKSYAKMEARGTNRSSDIRIENFDIAYGDRVLLQGADLTLSHGRRFGLVGRNGLGKTTLLRMLESRQLAVPAHISVLHVEQEVQGDETTALGAVLEADGERMRLLERETVLQKLIHDGNQDEALSSELSEVYAQLQLSEADKAPARASVILSGLGFNAEAQARPTKTFSGGWRMRLALARALFSLPDLLLLDEPTNMLDMKAIIWLEKYLEKWPKTLLVVSHDRNFLDAIATDILHLHSQRIDTYRGNYTAFERARSEKLRAQQREYEAQQQQRAHVEQFIARFRYNANRASSVQSKIKMLEKLPQLRPVQAESLPQLGFPDDIEPLAPPPILQLSEVSFWYSPDKVILDNVSLSANLQSRICIVGENGAGKTTLLKLLLGLLEPCKGIRQCHRNLRLGYFTQHHVDQMDMNLTCVELMQQVAPGLKVEEYRRQLGSFGISGDLALQRLSSLSGGQKSRVAFARMCATKPQMLILDEPTNHLDIETIEALAQAINVYKGGAVLVSHDQRLLKAVCTELWLCANQDVKVVENGFDEYRELVEREIQEQQHS